MYQEHPYHPRLNQGHNIGSIAFTSTHRARVQGTSYGFYGYGFYGDETTM